MKQSLRTAVLAALLATGMARGATTASQQVQTVNFALTATVQGPSTATGTCTTASLATKDVIAALGRALNQTFSSKAQLVLLGDAANGFRFYVQDVVGKTNVDTLVNDNFSMNELGAVTKATISKGIVTTGSEYEVGLLAIQTPTLNLSLYGYGKQSLATGALTASGVGSGTVGTNQNQAIFKGKVTFSAMKAQ
ncbi:MAG: hypothetical protein ACLQM8_06895 [Limisphaerales bacterium]